MPFNKHAPNRLLLQLEDDCRFKTVITLFLRPISWNLSHLIVFNSGIGGGADGGDPASARANAAELARLSPDVILVNSATSLNALVQETRTVPTVFVNVGEQSVMLCLR